MIFLNTSVVRKNVINCPLLSMLLLNGVIWGRYEQGVQGKDTNMFNTATSFPFSPFFFFISVA
jgi:hypothetical protein